MAWWSIWQWPIIWTNKISTKNKIILFFLPADFVKCTAPSDV